METTERLQQQLESLGDLRSIVRTMKAMSAVSIRQYETAVHALADYFHTVEQGLYVVLRARGESAGPPPPMADTPHAAIVFGSDHGLCGRFNEDIATFTLAQLRQVAHTDEPCRLLVIGARAAGQLEDAGQRVEENFLVPGAAARIAVTVQHILLKLDEWRRAHKIDHVHLFYNRTTPGGTYQPTHIRLLPVQLQRFRRLDGKDRWPSRSLPGFTMPANKLLDGLLQQYFFVTLFRACAESQAAEHTSRLNAMQSASSNLDERIEEVTGQYRRVRQDNITSELIDVTTGFNALTGGEL
ncbi:ATP synthase subunit gamma [Candidatus Tenderia electrophaga]|jgi:F-type H+-transporting ATPase subunit gamma|uniref:ATP synthase subunit gamma n=1 Tax=Candidatus Tenderia electrophaga TaxID=1748243 RepID=A0A0S2TFE7_9GAMM|nr:ATP synthase subunit gamma [Candidatus Tenderia electrophaga]